MNFIIIFIKKRRTNKFKFYYLNILCYFWDSGWDILFF